MVFLKGLHYFFSLISFSGLYSPFNLPVTVKLARAQLLQNSGNSINACIKLNYSLESKQVTCTSHLIELNALSDTTDELFSAPYATSLSELVQSGNKLPSLNRHLTRSVFSRDGFYCVWLFGEKTRCN